MMLDLREGGGTARASAPLVLGAQDLPASIGLFETAEESKSGAVLQRVLDETGWNISETARRLGVNRSTVHRQITRNGMVRRRG
jgi:transcriptional regulator of acetoin/glycerol metabolism